jgi:zinc transport system substrate-binding protein
MGQGRTGAGHVVSRTGICRRAIGLGLLLLSVITAGTGARAQQGGDLKVVATIKPVHSLVAQVMAGLGQPVLLVDGQASPHSFSLKPSDARALADAEVVVRVAASVEPFTVRLAETLGAGTQLVTLAEAPGVELLETRRGTTFEVHDHATEADRQHDGHDENKNAEHKHDDAVKSQGHDHEHGALDGHIWLDPGNAKAIVRNVADVLAERRPDLKEKLDANAATAVAAIDALDKELMATLAAVKGKRFIVFHDAYQYFEHHYGLQAAGAITLNPEVKPSARRLSEIRETLSKSGAACVFAEPQFSPRIVAAVIEGTKAKAGTLDPLGVDVPAGSDHYAGAMRALAKAMAGCLGG